MSCTTTRLVKTIRRMRDLHESSPTGSRSRWINSFRAYLFDAHNKMLLQKEKPLLQMHTSWKVFIADVRNSKGCSVVKS